jgi:hypothetical protein
VWECRKKVAQSMLCATIMMILHQMQHGRQDNHATNHVRCTKTRKAGQSRRQIEAKQSETIYLCNVWSTKPTKQSSGKASRQCLWGKRNSYARAQGNLDANKQERMMRANFIPALCQCCAFRLTSVMVRPNVTQPCSVNFGPRIACQVGLSFDWRRALRTRLPSHRFITEAMHSG